MTLLLFLLLSDLSSDFIAHYHSKHDFHCIPFKQTQTEPRGFMFVLLQQQKIVRYYRCRQLISMLLTKKSKGIEDKNKPRLSETIKKVKKNKNQSPNKHKLTPQKKKVKKDQNILSSRLHTQNFTQSIEFHKSKEKQTARASNIKKNAAFQHKNKLLTTSPVLFERSTSKSKKKSKQKSKSKSRSISKINTQRSNVGEREKSRIKSVTKRLYLQGKESNHEKSKSKQKSKSKNKGYTEKSVSPLKEVKHTKSFNVADRQIKMKTSNQQNEMKKAIKKKVQNRMKGETFIYPQVQKLHQENFQPKIKLKKKIPQIKTEFSERRGSYFDENLLKKLEFGQVDQKKQDICPFQHIKSSFQYKMQNMNGQMFSRSEMKVYQQTNCESQMKAKQIDFFRKQQQKKWSKMLHQLVNLKNQKKIPEKIDQIIKQINQNYSSLQQRSSALSKASIPLQLQENGADKTEREMQSQNSLKEHQSEEEFVNYVNKQSNNQYSQKEFFDQHPFAQILEQQKQAINHQQQNQRKPLSRDQHIQLIEKISQQSVKFSNDNESSIFQNEKKININQILKSQITRTQNVQNLQKHQNKKSNAITINNDFFDFFQNKQEKKLRKEILESNPMIQQIKSANNSNEIIFFDQNKQSDKNILQQLNILQGSSFIEVVSFSKQNKNDFIAQMQQIRQIQSQQFHRDLPLDFSPNQDPLIKMNHDMSSQSMLLPNMQLGPNNDGKLDILVSEIEHILILQFCTNILRSKEILHNFLTTYSEMVEANVINVDYGYDENKPVISSSNQYVIEVIKRLINHFQVNYRQFFMRQIQQSFECKPMEILRFIRCVDEDAQSLVISQRQSSQNVLVMPFFGLQKIEQFQIEVLKNQYYIPNYFSFNHSIYDLFNDIFDELRPYGSKGKPFFSLALGHGINQFDEAKKLFQQKVNKTLSLKYYEEPIPEQKYPSDEGVFELVYFMCLDVLEQIFDDQTILLYKVLNRVPK